MLPDRLSNPGPLTYESGALPIALHGPASWCEVKPSQHAYGEQYSAMSLSISDKSKFPVNLSWDDFCNVGKHSKPCSVAQARPIQHT